MGVSPQHFTLVANTVKTFTFNIDFVAVEVLNVDGAAKVWFTLDGSDPVVGQDGCQVLPAAIGSVEVDPSAHGSGKGPTVVKAISDGTPLVSVRGV